MRPTPPKDKELLETELGTYWFDDDGILISLSKPPLRTLENVRANIEGVRKFSGNKKVPLLVYISNSGKPTKETRDYVAKHLPSVYTAMAMIVPSALGKLIMNLIFGLQSPSIPMKTFSNEAKAREWLKRYK